MSILHPHQPSTIQHNQLTMHALTLIFLAAVATAGTADLTPGPASFLTVSQADAACGENLYLSCCGSELDVTLGHGDVGKTPGVVGGVLDGISLFDRCSIFSPSNRKWTTPYEYLSMACANNLYEKALAKATNWSGSIAPVWLRAARLVHLYVYLCSVSMTSTRETTC